MIRILVSIALLSSTLNLAAVDFRTQVFPVLNRKCAECHSVAKDKVKGKFAVDRQEDYSKFIKAGEPQKSSLMFSVTLPDNDEDVMPPKGKNRMTPAEVAALKTWIEEGANFEAGAAPAPAPTAAPAAPAAPAAMLSWTNTQGKIIQASFGGIHGDLVKLTLPDGTVHHYPLSNLSAESQAQARQLGGQ